jgi:subtilisin family serine protease
MTPSIKLSVLAVALTVAVSSMAQAQSVLSSPFGAAPASGPSTLVSISKAQAQAALSPAGGKKADRKHLDRMLEQESNQFIVVFKDQAPARVAVTSNKRERMAMQIDAYAATRKRVRAQLNTSDIEFVREYKAMPMAYARVNTRAALVKLMNHADVKYVVENVTLEQQTSSSLPLIGQPGAATAGRAGAGTTVVVLDGGVNIQHTAFGCTAKEEPKATCRVVETKPLGTASYTSSTHGTNVAGIVTAVAGGATIASGDIMTTPGKSNLDTMLRGMDWALELSHQRNVVALNLSFGMAASACDDMNLMASVLDAFSALRSNGIVPVIASGNDADTAGISFPACVPGAVAVGAVYDGNVGAKTYYTDATNKVVRCVDASTSADMLACFSNSSELTTLLAPGVNVSAAGVTQSGTSQAAPHVAGAVAVLRGANAAPDDNVEQTVARMVASGVPITNPKNNVSTPRLDLSAALKGLIPDPAYRMLTQQIFVAYFGRPADPAGLAWHAAQLRAIGAPSTLAGLYQAYGTNPAVRAHIDSFGASAESNALYGGDNRAFVTAIYANLFNREPDTAGRDFWVNHLNNGTMSRGSAALSIMAAASGTDATIVDRKSTVAVNFTKALDLAPEIVAYSGLEANKPARAMLKQVSSTTNVSAFQATVDATIARIVAGQ